MNREQNAELTPDQEYLGKLKDATSFGGTIYAFTLQSEEAEQPVHVGPFEFDRPIDAYVGQQVAIRVSGERTAMGIFSARMRWLNPRPIDRKGSRSKTEGKAAESPKRKGKGKGRRRPHQGSGPDKKGN